ncbi:PoNe immunity protein domain-containing protein [Roseibium sediminis]|uniref:PoNe immunity protein domain-containing protein n=1 Tax=Roseibium sediminis TaxID=1775174 RepID=UPI001375BB3B|nr:PoNe immunity protein domain-containing protein [Roseibium sediminis]
MRDTYKDMAYFEAQLQNDLPRKQKSIEKLANPDITDQAKQARLDILFDIQLDRTLTFYNIGKPVDEVIGELNAAWPLFIEAHNFSASNSREPSGKLQLTPAEKNKIFPLLVLSNAPKAITDTIFDYTNSILNYEVDVAREQELDVGFDPFTYEFAKYLNYLSARVHDELTWPALYGKLYECFTRHEGHRPDILKEYVDNWQKIATKEEWYLKDEHKMDTNDEFRGYWCFLGAAVAKMLKIDDLALKDHPHYPYDLVHYMPS